MTPDSIAGQRQSQPRALDTSRDGLSQVGHHSAYGVRMGPSEGNQVKHSPGMATGTD